MATPVIIEPSVFRPAVEGLFINQLGARIDAATRGALTDLGVDLDHLASAYTTTVLDDCHELLAARLYPDWSTELALRELGRLQVRGFLHAPIGKAVFLIARLFSRERLLERLCVLMRQANNFVETKALRLSDEVWEVDVNHVGRHPPIMAGILEELMRNVGHPAEVELTWFAGTSACYRLTYQPP